LYFVRFGQRTALLRDKKVVGAHCVFFVRRFHAAKRVLL
jgi:hypothetical protein